MDIGIEMIEMSRMLEMSTTSEKEVKIMQGRIREMQKKISEMEMKK